MKFYKKCEMIMLNTKEQSTTYLEDDNTLTVYNHPQRPSSKGQAKYFYVLSDDKIKTGDWFIELDLNGTRSSYADKVYHCNIGNDGSFILTKDINFPFPENCRKIIATNDLILLKGWIKDNDPQRLSDHTDFVTMKGLNGLSKLFLDVYSLIFNYDSIASVEVEYWDNRDYNPSMFEDIRPMVNPNDNTLSIKIVIED